MNVQTANPCMHFLLCSMMLKCFGSPTHTGDAPKSIVDTMEFVCGMNMVKVGPFLLKENLVGRREGIQACQGGKAIGEKL